ncbi:MAG: ATP-binding cassette domain-containing protein [Fibrobacteraceae bacterium]|nr:ATP-binding cassette domain-containing protein [Fibrobacteraceae bacterium]
MQTSIRVEHISKNYGNRCALNDINFTLNAGEFICLLGPSGCGKSTLLRLIAGLDTPTKGKIFFNEKEVTHLPASKRNFGIVFQSYALFPNLTAYENVAYGLRNRRMKKKEIDEKVCYYLDMVGLLDAGKQYPAQLSGGQQQRIALARALTVQPDFLLLDEPLSALDAKVRVKLRQEICRIQRELGITTIMVTHDQKEAMTMADRIIVMDKARLMQEGTPQEIYNNPNSHFVADFIGAINFYKENGITEAIRPECIEINTEPKGIQAVLSNIEFQGNICRLSTKPKQKEIAEEIFIDIPSNNLFKMDVSVGSLVYLNFPRQHILNF